MTPRNSLILATVMVSSLIAARAGATLARAVSFDEKVDRAEAIVRGRCVKTTAGWDNSHRWILTYSTFQVEETMKGTAAAEVTLVTPGGTVDGIHQESVGIRPFRTGDENVVFVRNTAEGPTVLFFDQGAYDVKPDPQGDKLVVPVATGAVLIDTQRGMAVAAEPARPLSEFRQRIRTAVERAPKRMEMVREPRPREASIWESFANFRVLGLLAAVGLVVSGWQLFRR